MDYLQVVAILWVNAYWLHMCVTGHRQYPEELNGRILLMLATVFLVVNCFFIFGIERASDRFVIAGGIPFAMMLWDWGHKAYHNLPGVKLAQKKKEEEKTKRELEAVFQNIAAPEVYAADFFERLIVRCLSAGFLPPPEEVRSTIRSIAAQLYAADFCDPTTKMPNAKIQAAVQNKTATLENILAIFDGHLTELFAAYAYAIPAAEGLIRVPFTSIVPAATVVTAMLQEIWKRPPKTDYDLFAVLYKKVDANYWTVTRAHLSEKKVAAGERIWQLRLSISTH